MSLKPTWATGEAVSQLEALLIFFFCFCFCFKSGRMKAILVETENSRGPTGGKWAKELLRHDSFKVLIRETVFLSF